MSIFVSFFFFFKQPKARVTLRPVDSLLTYYRIPFFSVAIVQIIYLYILQFYKISRNWAN